MIDIFLLVCLKTNVDCSEVGVSYANTLPHAWGVTTLYSNGMQHIEIDASLSNRPVIKAAVMLHEFTHVYLNDRGNTDAGHGIEFIEACNNLAKLSGLPRLACQESL